MRGAFRKKAVDQKRNTGMSELRCTACSCAEGSYEQTKKGNDHFKLSVRIKL